MRFLSHALSLDGDRLLAMTIVTSLAIGIARGDDVPRPDTTDVPAPVARVIAEAAAAVEADPDRAEAWGDYAMVLHGHACKQEADLAYAQAQRLAPDEFRWPYFRGVMFVTIDPAQALAFLDLALERDPGYGPAHIRRGLALETLGREDEALRSYREAVRLEPGNVSGHIHLGQLALKRGELDQAVHHLEKALADRPDDATVLSSLAQSYARQGDRVRARAMADAARQNDVGRVVDDRRFNEVAMKAVTLQAFLVRANVYFTGGRLDDAVREVERGRELYGDSGLLHEALAKIHLSRGELKRCIESAQIALSEGARDDGQLHLILAAAEFQRGGLDEAEAAVRSALTATPHDLEALRLSGQIAVARGDDAEAVRRWSRGLEVEEDPVMQRWRANALVRLGRHDEALSALEQVLQEMPDDPETLLALGEAHRSRGDLDAALAAFDQAARRAETPYAGRQGVMVLLEQGEFADAQRRLRALRAKWPQNPNLVNDLAWLLATSPEEGVRDGAEALRLVEPLVQQTRRGEPALLDTLAAALAATGRFADAVEAMDEALALLPASASVARRAAFEARRTAYVNREPWRQHAAAEGPKP